MNCHKNFSIRCVSNDFIPWIAIHFLIHKLIRYEPADTSKEIHNPAHLVTSIKKAVTCVKRPPFSFSWKPYIIYFYITIIWTTSLLISKALVCKKTYLYSMCSWNCYFEEIHRQSAENYVYRKYDDWSVFLGKIY